MKIIDKKGKLFGLINIVDLTVILVIVLIAAGIIYKVSDLGLGENDDTKTFTAVVKCPLAIENAALNLNVGDVIVYSNEEVNGKIVKVEYENAVEKFYTPDGTVKEIVHDDLKDIYVTVEITVPKDNNLVMLGKYQVNIGKKFFMKTSRVEIEGYVIDLYQK